MTVEIEKTLLEVQPVIRAVEKMPPLPFSEPEKRGRLPVDSPVLLCKWFKCAKSCFFTDGLRNEKINERLLIRSLLVGLLDRIF